MKTKRTLGTSLALLIGGANLAGATTITFTESVTGGGYLGAMKFSNSPITVTATGDTSNLTGSGNLLSLTGTAVTINIASLGVTATLTDTSNVFVCHNCGEGSFGITDDTVSKQGTDILDIFGSAIKPYDLKTSFGPVTTNMPSINGLASFNTNEGPFAITSLTGTDPGITFSALLEIQPVAAFLDQYGAPALTFNGSTNFPDAGGFLIGAPGSRPGPERQCLCRRTRWRGRRPSQQLQLRQLGLERLAIFGRHSRHHQRSNRGGRSQRSGLVHGPRYRQSLLDQLLERNQFRRLDSGGRWDLRARFDSADRHSFRRHDLRHRQRYRRTHLVQQLQPDQPDLHRMGGSPGGDDRATVGHGGPGRVGLCRGAQRVVEQPGLHHADPGAKCGRRRIRG